MCGLLADLIASHATIIALMALTLLAACRVLFTWFLLPEEDKGKEWRRLMHLCVISVIACALSLRLLFSEYSGVENLILEGSEGSAPSYYILYLRARTCRLQVLHCRPSVPIHLVLQCCAAFVGGPVPLHQFRSALIGGRLQHFKSHCNHEHRLRPQRRCAHLRSCLSSAQRKALSIARTLVLMFPRQSSRASRMS
jgi:hypothetical protein